MTPTQAQERAAAQAVREQLCIQCDDCVPLCHVCARCRICGHQDWCKHEDYR